MKKRIKRTFSIHHWIGLLAGILLLISSITGAVLVFHHEIDSAQFSDKTTLEKPATKLIIDNSFEPIRTLYPDCDIRIPDLPKEPDQALKYELRKGKIRKWIFVHPETGELLTAVERADQRLVHILLELHYMLLSGTVGKIMVLFLGVALIILSISGFMLYRKSIVKVLSFKQKISFKSRRSLFSGLHRIIGVWSLVFNLFISITGTYIAFTIVQGAFPSGGKAVMQSPPISISIDAALAKIEREYPAFEVNYLLFPKNADGKLRILGRLESDPSYYGFNYSNIQVNTKTGEIASTSFLRNLPWYKRAITIFKPLHFGDYGGLSMKLIYCFFGILPGVLAISGFFIWRLRPAKKPRTPFRSPAKTHARHSTA